MDNGVWRVLIHFLAVQLVASGEEMTIVFPFHFRGEGNGVFPWSSPIHDKGFILESFGAVQFSKVKGGMDECRSYHAMEV